MSFWPQSTRMAATLLTHHRPVAKCELLYDGEVLATIAGEGNTGVSDAVRLVDGNVSVERNVVRRAGDVTFLDLNRELDDLLVPWRGEVRLYRGAIIADATPLDLAAPPADREYVPILTGVVTKPIGGDARGQRQVGLKDRMALISQQKFVVPYKVVPNIPISTAMIRLLTAKLPGGRRDYTIADTGASTAQATSLVYDEQADPAEALADLATAAGMVVYADQMGRIVADVEPEPDPDDAVLVLQPGPQSVMLRPVRERDAETAWNTVVVTSESTDLTIPVRAVVHDENPSSATYWRAVGEFPFYWSHPSIKTVNQAQVAATTILRTRLGLSDTIVQGLAPNPSLDVGDVLRVVDPDQEMDVAVVVDGFSLGLRTDGPMSLTCRTAAAPL